MDQKQVDVSESNLFHTGTCTGQRGFNAVVDRVHDLGGDIDVFARDAAVADRLPDLELVGVVLRGVDVAVAEFEGGAAGGDAHFGGGEVDAEADARDGQVGLGEGDDAVQGECGHIGDGGNCGGRGWGGGGEAGEEEMNKKKKKKKKKKRGEWRGREGRVGRVGPVSPSPACYSAWARE